ncbi:hypothetical protein [Mycolicibacterium porcinum]|uniref:hypothetical protein n=1 Tax=Mycolicibacterium porcinum TaxID=39693 RepID=UPI001041D314|nr:hypothetical protein [Mycolicibacterium porcinum]
MAGPVDHHEHQALLTERSWAMPLPPATPGGRPFAALPRVHLGAFWPPRGAGNRIPTTAFVQS